MPRSIKPPQTLKERYGTLEKYFVATADKHNGLLKRDFLLRMNPKRKHKTPVTVAAEDFNVSTHTWYGWLKWHLEEQGAITSRQQEAEQQRQAE